jgi:probable rRNA maturation factor
MGPPDDEVGELKVFGTDEQHAAPVDVERWVELARNVLVAEGVSGDAELSLLFVDEPTISGLNRRFMDADGPTDVLAFPLDDPVDGAAGHTDARSPGPAPLLLGDVVVCPAVAERQAPEHAGSYADELALLVVHGVLHVVGHDHAGVDEAATMQARERELLQRFHRGR